MADVKWIKMDIDLFNNRKIKQIEILPDGDAIIVIWVKLLCLAGNINDGGQIYFTQEIPYTDQMLATQFNRPIATVQLALKTFEQFGMIEVIDNMLHISNWERYQNVDRLNELREYNRIAQQKSRAKRKMLPVNDMSMTSQSCHDTDIEVEEEKKREDKTRIDKKNSEAVAYYPDDPDLEESFQSFISMRKRIKAPMTEKAIKLAQKKLEEMSGGDVQMMIQILDQSTMNSWRGLFPLKTTQQEKKPKSIVDSWANA